MNFPGLEERPSCLSTDQGRGKQHVTDTDLLEAIRQGDADALDEVFNRYRKVVYAICLRVLGNEAEAENVLVDVFTELWRRPERVGVKSKTVSSYLLKLARERATEQMRDPSTCEPEAAVDEPRDGDVADGNSLKSPEASWIVERRRQARRAMAMLPPGQRVAVQYAFFDGLSHHEIAARLDLPVSIVKTRVHLGLARFRDEMIDRCASQPIAGVAPHQSKLVPSVAG
ncbi:RNA polymerase sigma factor [Phycisphaerales bacterium AB-hyl4]|uniref:RNA polymerase sigma factor n=1 Tax=Natronomicrosphaera hydrolytica TaxID=3242702 RepID=A0ABV4U2E4_9BACT